MGLSSLGTNLTSRISFPRSPGPTGKATETKLEAEKTPFPKDLSQITFAPTTAASEPPKQLEVDPNKSAKHAERPHTQTGSPTTLTILDDSFHLPQRKSCDRPSSPLEEYLKNLNSLSEGFPAPLTLESEQQSFESIDEIRKILGRVVSPETLGKVYESAVPGTKAIVGYRTLDQNRLFTSVSLRNGEGQTVGNFLRVYQREPEGSLELQRGVAWVDPAYRGQAVSDRVASQEISFLRGLSDHPDTRVTLNAGGASAPGQARQNLGKYVWAKAGIFDFGEKRTADELLGPSEQLHNMKVAYQKWVDKLGLEDVDKVKRLSHDWSHPKDIADTDLPGVRVPNQDPQLRPGSAHLGKAFLLSDDAPEWGAVCFVNRPPCPKTALGLSGMKDKIEAAESEHHIRDKSWEARLNTGDLTVLKEIGRDGDESWIERLQTLKNAPTEVLEQLSGEALPLQLEQIALDQDQDPAIRIRVLAEMTQLGHPLEADSARALLLSPDDSVAKTSLNVLWNSGHHDASLLQEAASVTFERFQVNPKMPFQGRSARLDAARILMSTREEQQLTALLDREKDSVVAQGLRDCLASLESEKPVGIAAYAVGDYPSGLW